MPATTQDLDIILKIRSGANNLKPLGSQYIQEHIQEFVRAILSDGTTVGIMRLFMPEETLNIIETIEMGSFVKTKSVSVPGISTTLIQYAEYEAMIRGKTLIAITSGIAQNNQPCLASCLKWQGWTNQSTAPEYSKRLAESSGKELWEKIPRRLDADSKALLYP